MSKRPFDPTLYPQCWFRDSDTQSWTEGYYLHSIEGPYPHLCVLINGGSAAFKEITFENPHKRDPIDLDFIDLSEFKHVWCRDKTTNANGVWRDGYYVAFFHKIGKFLVAINHNALILFDEISYEKPEGIE